MISPETWPNPKTSMRDAVMHLIGLLKLGHDDYRLGKTKVFIKEPRSIFALEALREKELPRLLSITSLS